MAASKSTVFTSRWAADIRIAAIGVLLVLAGCSTAGRTRLDAFNESAGPMIAVRLATVAAVQGDPTRAQAVVAEADRLIAEIDAGQSIAIEVLVPVLNTRIAEAALKPAERAILTELVSVAAEVVRTDSLLPADAKARLRLVLTWVRSAALGQAA